MGDELMDLLLVDGYFLVEGGYYFLAEFET